MKENEVLIELLQKYMPNAYQIANIDNATLEKTIDKYVKSVPVVELNEVIGKPHSLFTLILLAKSGDRKSVSLLYFFDEVIKELYNLLDNAHQNNFKEKVKRFILDIDKCSSVCNPQNPAFLNHIGEIIYAHRLILSKSENYEFCGFDVKIHENNKDVDLKLRRIDDGKSIYIDNLNIHNIEPSKVENSLSFSLFLKNKVDDKIKQKTIDLRKVGNDYIINGELAEFYVAPILWNEQEELLPYKDTFDILFRSNILDYVFYALLPQKKNDGTYVYSLETVCNILDRWLEYQWLQVYEDKMRVKVYLQIYCQEAITAACYKFSNKYYISQELDGDVVTIILQSKDNSQISNNEAKMFHNELIDEQIRVDTNKKFGHIRDLIVEEAFKPVNERK